MYCLSFYLIQIQSYHAFSDMAVDNWCLSLNISNDVCQPTRGLFGWAEKSLWPTKYYNFN